jgi:hypothetical protein
VVERAGQVAPQQLLRGELGRRGQVVVLQEVAKRMFAVLAHWRIERDRAPRRIEHPLDALDRLAQRGGDLLRCRLTLHRLLELVRGALDLADRLAHMHRQSDRPPLLGDRAGDGLADPPCRIGGETVAFGGVELLDRAHQADVALLDEIQQGQTAPDVFLGDRDDQPQVGLDQVLPGLAPALDLLFERKTLFPGLVFFVLNLGVGVVAGLHLGSKSYLTNFLRCPT